MSAESQQPYKRVDAEQISTNRPAPADAQEGAADTGVDVAASLEGDLQSRSTRIDVRWWIIPLSVLLCVAQAVATVLATNMSRVTLTPTLISVIAFGTLFLTVLIINPMLRAVFREKILRPLHRAELMCVFTAMLVTSGISTFGLTDQLVPMVATPWNEEWNTAQRGWSDDVLPHLNPSLYISAPADAPEGASAEEQEQIAAEQERFLSYIRDFRQGLRPVDAEGRTMTRPPEGAPLVEKIDYWWALFWQIPWEAWVGPLAGWLVFIGACYAMFYSLTYVALGYWVRREKLIFPLAQLPEQLLPDDTGRKWLPAIMRTSGFWAAFALVFAVWSWNGAIAAEWIPGLSRINLGMGRGTVTDILSGGILEGLTGGGDKGFQFLIIFTAIGVAFLLPTEISFSLWFYYLVGKIIILVLVWFGHGQTGDDFPSDGFLHNNTVTAQGGGALLMFAGISLGRAISDFVRLGRGMTPGQKVRLGIPVIGLGISLAVIFGWLMWNDLPLIWALIVTAVLMLITMGLMRVVAEGGIYWFQLHTSPMHLYQAFGLGHIFKPAFAMVPLIPIYSVLFFDTKTFLAPNLANAGRMQDSVGASRTKFHLNIILCIVISVIVAIGFTIFIAHLMGAQQMHGWFYASGPPWIVDHARDVIGSEPTFDFGIALSYIFGGAWVMFSMFIRSVLFWFPHPIGYVMLANPLMSQLWFSFFLGWIAKKLVVKYGGKQTFDYTRPIFIGIIMGELIAVLLWAIFGIMYDFQPGVTLNRYSP